MKKLAILVLTVFLMGIAFPVLADTTTTATADTTTTPVVSGTTDSTSNTNDTTVNNETNQSLTNSGETQLPIDLNVLNSLSYSQLKQLKEEIENLLEQKEEEIQEFKGIVTSFDGQILIVKNDSEEKTFIVTPATELEVKGELSAGYKAEVKYDPATNEALRVEAKLITLEYTGTVISFDGSKLTVARGNGEQKTFNITDNTKIEGLGKVKGEKTIKPGYKVGVKYTLVGNAVEVKVVPAKVEKEKERKSETKREKEQKAKKEVKIKFSKNNTKGKK